MFGHVIDPAPRKYVANVSLQARSARGRSCAPESQTVAEIADWLLLEAVRIDDIMLLFEEFMWRCHVAGLQIDRASLHIGTLHPRVIGFSWLWSASDGLCDEIAASASAVESDSFKKNPIFKVIMNGETVGVDLTIEEQANSTQLMRELAGEGYTAYYAMPLSAAGKWNNAVTAATKNAGGFGAATPEEKQLLHLFGLHVERHIVQRIARNVADTYLGPIAGRRVLDGEIKRGDGDSIEAVVLISDLRRFTSLADRLSGPEVTAILNAYFNVVTGAVKENGGEILKFIGDGILAVFDRKALGESAAAEAALKAAEIALARLESFNLEPNEQLADKRLWCPLKMGIGLHTGEVFFGNIGGEERLDFTVIGRAINETSRVEALCRPLGRTLLVTENVRSLLSDASCAKLDGIGDYELRGVGSPVAIYAPVSKDAA